VSRTAAIAKQLVRLARRVDRRLIRLGNRCCAGRSQLLLDRARRRAG
jgi:hypothetical protein